MNIKRIIQEEVDDFDWVGDTNPPSLTSKEINVDMRVRLNNIGSNIHQMYLDQSGGGEGTVIGVNAWIDVRWDNGHENSYPPHFLTPTYPINESDDFDFIRDTNPINLERGGQYIINLCGEKFYNTPLQGSIKDKFIELFGDKIISGTYGNSYVNWFNNFNMVEDVYLILTLREPTPSNPFGVNGGWNDCTPEYDEEFEDYHEEIEDYMKTHTHLTVNQFLTATFNK